MSSIPNSAMPTAGPVAEAEEGETVTLGQRVRDGADRVADLVRENPKTAIAAGAAVAAGVAAAAAIPLVRGRRGKSGGGGSSKAGTTGGGKSAGRGAKKKG